MGGNYDEVGDCRSAKYTKSLYFCRLSIDNSSRKLYFMRLSFSLPRQFIVLFVFFSHRLVCAVSFLPHLIRRVSIFYLFSISSSSSPSSSSFLPSFLLPIALYICHQLWYVTLFENSIFFRHSLQHRISYHFYFMTSFTFMLDPIQFDAVSLFTCDCYRQMQ